MNKKTVRWKLVVACGLSLALCTHEAFAFGRGGGGGRPPGGGGGSRPPGGGGGYHPQGGGGGGRPQSEGGSRPQGNEGGRSPNGQSNGSRPGNTEGSPSRSGYSQSGSGYHAGGYSQAGGSSAARSPSMTNAASNSRTSGEYNRNNVAGGNQANVSGRNLSGNTNVSGNTVNVANRNVNGAGAYGAAGYHPSYANHGYYNGSWNGHYGAAYGLGAASTAYRPAAWGAAAWGMGAGMYSMGYASYSNPYYGSGGGGGGGYNYSQPIPVPAPTQSAAAPQDDNAGSAPADAAQPSDPATPPEAGNAEEQLSPAIDAFKIGDFETALAKVNDAITATPTDAVAHEFRGLVLFAKKDYQQSAATIHALLAVGPGWDWTTLSSFYNNIADYTDQLRALETYVEAHPQEGAPRFLAAYHYLTCGHPDAAATQLKLVVKLVPGDKLAADLLKMVSPPPAGGTAPPEPKSDATPVDSTQVVGDWKASRDDGSRFELTLTDDAQFTWTFTAKQQPASTMSGSYTLDGALLELTPQGGNPLVGQLTFGGDGGFNFKIVGSPPDDLGLNFAK